MICSIIRRRKRWSGKLGNQVSWNLALPINLHTPPFLSVIVMMIVVGYSMTIVYASYSKPLVYRNPIGPPRPIRPSSPQKIDSDLVLWYMAKSSRHCQRTMWWSRHLENADTVIRCRFVSWWHPAVKVISCGFRQNSDWSGVTSWELKMLLCPVEGHIKHTLSEYVSSIWHQALSL